MSAQEELVIGFPGNRRNQGVASVDGSAVVTVPGISQKKKVPRVSVGATEQQVAVGGKREGVKLTGVRTQILKNLNELRTRRHGSVFEWNTR